jgi:hypothetical protein
MRYLSLREEFIASPGSDKAVHDHGGDSNNILVDVLKASKGDGS